MDIQKIEFLYNSQDSGLVLIVLADLGEKYGLYSIAGQPGASTYVKHKTMETVYIDEAESAFRGLVMHRLSLTDDKNNYFIIQNLEKLNIPWFEEALGVRLNSSMPILDDNAIGRKFSI